MKHSAHDLAGRRVSVDVMGCDGLLTTAVLALRPAAEKRPTSQGSFCLQLRGGTRAAEQSEALASHRSFPQKVMNLGKAESIVGTQLLMRAGFPVKDYYWPLIVLDSVF